jgi:hypothetical protein
MSGKGTEINEADRYRSKDWNYTDCNDLAACHEAWHRAIRYKSGPAQDPPTSGFSLLSLAECTVQQSEFISYPTE